MLSGTNTNRRRFLGTAGMMIAGAQLGLSACAEAQPKEIRLPSFGKFPSLNGATAWLNSQPLVVPELLGKVALVDFWTYTCINWRRTLPYLRAWAERYKDRGLVVIGVHTPEFPFEHDAVNVRTAIKEMRIDYPIAIDNNYAIWRAFDNEFWPAIYFVDARGRIRYRKFGEGDYDQSESVIRQMLVEAGAQGLDPEVASIDANGVEAAADWPDLKSAENYLGYERTQNFASPGGAAQDKQRNYAFPTRMALNHWALAGNWTAGKQAIVSNADNGSISYQFHARDLNLVMGPAAPGKTVRFHVMIDGLPSGSAHGTDVDDQGAGVVSEPRMYQLIRQPKPIVDQRIEIRFLDPGVEAYSFTFG
jgi:thiol-disulfide isomerase/thioredoxin